MGGTKFHRARTHAKNFGMRLAHAGKQVGNFLDKGLGAAHKAVSHIDPNLVDAVARA